MKYSVKNPPPIFLSRKSANRFIEAGLSIISAKPHLHFHQTLTFAEPKGAIAAKKVFNRFLFGLVKFYQDFELAGLYVQRKQVKEDRYHFHVSFCFFDASKLPYCPSRMERDFRTIVFKRWKLLNAGKSVHPANKMIKHDFNQETLSFLSKAFVIKSVERQDIIYWGVFNKDVFNKRREKPTMREKKATFRMIFKRSKIQEENSCKDSTA